MEELANGLPKLGTAFAAVAVFLAVLLIVFFFAGRVHSRLQNPLAGVIFLGPAILLLFIGLVVPAFRTTYGSLFDANGKEFIGLQNYGWVFTTESMRQVLFNTAAWIVIAPVLSTALVSRV